MENILILMLKGNLCLIIGYFFYIVFVSKGTNFKANRFYLIVLLLLSVTLPFSNYSIDFSFFKEEKQTIIPAISMANLNDDVIVQEEPESFGEAMQYNEIKSSIGTKELIGYL